MKKTFDSFEYLLLTHTKSQEWDMIWTDYNFHISDKIL